MKSCLASGTDPGKPEKFLAYMVPVPDEVGLATIEIILFEGISLLHQ